MKLRIIHLGAVLSLLAMGLLGSGNASAHGGEVHDHGEDGKVKSAPVVAAAPRANAQSDEFELVAVLEEGGQMRLTLDRFATNAPVVGAKLEVDGNGQDAVAAETSPGVYVAKLGALAGAAPGTKLPLTISIEAGDSADLLTATLEVPASAAIPERVQWWRRWFANEAPVAAVKTASDAPLQRLADGSLFVPKSVQRRLGIRTVQVRTAELAASVELNGTVIADPETSGRIQAPFAGSVQPGPKGMPVGGRKVVKGEVLVYLRPVASAIEQGNQKAQLAELDAQLAIAGQRTQRLEQLAGAVPQKEIEAARIEHAALKQRRRFVAASVNSAEPLRAPVGGVISASHHLVAGQIVDASEILFEVVDPARLAVEALAYDPGIASTLQSASALAGEAALELSFVGGGRQLREQALPLLFRIVKPDALAPPPGRPKAGQVSKPEPHGGEHASPPREGRSGGAGLLAVGQPVKVVISTTRGIRGEAVPRQSLTKVGAGETAVWVHVGPERFAARKVRTQALDAAHAAVVDGLHDGDRVVTEGASLLSQVR